MTSHAGTAVNAGLSRHQLEVLHAGLLEQRSFRREQLLAIRRSSRQKQTSGGTGARAEVLSHLVVAARTVLADVEAALDRMDTGHYGQCRLCLGAIEVSRLRICPQAMFCADCHRRRESGR